MANEQVYRKVPDIVLRQELDQWALLFNPANGGVVGISPVGVALWQLLDDRRTVPDLVQGLDERCEGVPAEAAHEVVEYLDMLIKRGFLTTDTAAT